MGAIELMSTTTLPWLSNPSATPPGPNRAASTWGVSGTMVNDHFGLLRHLAPVAALPGTLVEQVLRRGTRVVDVQLVPCLGQMTSYGTAHDAEPMKPTFMILLLFTRGLLCRVLELGGELFGGPDVAPRRSRRR